MENIICLRSYIGLVFHWKGILGTLHIVVQYQTWPDRQWYNYRTERKREVFLIPLLTPLRQCVHTENRYFYILGGPGISELMRSQLNYPFPGIVISYHFHSHTLNARAIRTMLGLAWDLRMLVITVLVCNRCVNFYTLRD